MMRSISQQHVQSVRGFTMAEMIVYIAVLLFVAVGSLNLLLSLDDLMAKYRAEQFVFRSANTVLERLLSDIRDAETVSASSFVDPGSLTLTRTSGDTSSYNLVSGAVQLSENGNIVGDLTGENVTVNSLRFFSYASTTEFVRVEMTLSSTVGSTTISRTFNSGAVLRGTYE